MKALELIGENYESQNKLEEIGNKFYEGITKLYKDAVDGLEGIYDTVMAYGEKRGGGGGQGQQGGGRRNKNKEPCKDKKGLGYGQGSGRGSGQGRK